MLKPKTLAALAAVVVAVVLALLDRPDPASRLDARRAALEQRLESADIRVSPEETLELLYNPAARLHLLDVREEAEFNLFHLGGARRAALSALARGDAGAIRRDDVVVVMSNGEGRARQAWLLLAAAGFEQTYILRGGIHGWLGVFGRPDRLDPSLQACELDDCRRYRFEAALGERHPESDPGPHALEGRSFERKVRVQGAQRRKSGSCG
ncbi:MAG TPA: rhodanese-like domain-containing protein [Thermoanaerobaculaceae bacterium]|nr:rhodanese-like domain-containing protein [Thermoanaerobaculaceae bacterium]HRS15098.1 rhodanese-like domain-containing protein [Thermoanaerobaculaceae bacterium]